MAWSRFYVEDATGVSYLDTFQDDSPEARRKFREHVAWWKRYVRSAHGRAAYRDSAKGGPAFPVRIVVTACEEIAA
jgi:hypothetical protein